MADAMMERTIYLVGESRNHAAESSPVFDEFEMAENYANDNHYSIYKATVWADAAQMVEVEDEDD